MREHTEEDAACGDGVGGRYQGERCAGGRQVCGLQLGMKREIGRRRAEAVWRMVVGRCIAQGNDPEEGHRSKE
ncbi:hypothetical protein NDU88_010488 [Pleurodeles waltl]|uniref:Uncharacterized protein n=1 Tax=Pleurodeles waltl TaxID=8319 RepID=A0AAV7QUI3_PLEWA|nr:hypothetical protein NDU88_010488 [Pleurodeles waltl]